MSKKYKMKKDEFAPLDPAVLKHAKKALKKGLKSKKPMTFLQFVKKMYGKPLPAFTKNIAKKLAKAEIEKLLKSKPKLKFGPQNIVKFPGFDFPVMLLPGTSIGEVFMDGKSMGKVSDIKFHSSMEDNSKKYECIKQVTVGNVTLPQPSKPVLTVNADLNDELRNRVRDVVGKPGDYLDQRDYDDVQARLLAGFVFMVRYCPCGNEKCINHAMEVLHIPEKSDA